MPRLFFALEASPEVRNDVEREIERLRATRADVKWSSGDHLHVTLRFLGEIADASLPDLRGLLAESCRGSRPLALEGRGVGSFPGGRNPRVIWAGVAGTDDPSRDALFALRRRLHEGASALFHSAEREDFRPHITLGRVRSPRNLRPLVEEIQAGREREFGRFEVREILLVQSRLTPSGSIYTTVATSALGGP